VLEVCFTAEMLKIRVLTPDGANFFIGQAFDVFQETEPCHQANGPGRATIIRTVKAGKVTFQTIPVNQCPKLYQFVARVNDILKARTKEVILTVLARVLLEHKLQPFKGENSIRCSLQHTKSLGNP